MVTMPSPRPWLISFISMCGHSLHNSCLAGAVTGCSWTLWSLLKPRRLNRRRPPYGSTLPGVDPSNSCEDGMTCWQGVYRHDGYDGHAGDDEWVWGCLPWWVVVRSMTLSEVFYGGKDSFYVRVLWPCRLWQAIPVHLHEPQGIVVLTGYSSVFNFVPTVMKCPKQRWKIWIAILERIFERMKWKKKYFERVGQFFADSLLR